MSWADFKAKVRDKGSVSTERLDPHGNPISGDQIVITWDDIKNVGQPIPELPVLSGAAAAAVADDEIIWED
jgi:hypothetical protein